MVLVQEKQVQSLNEHEQGDGADPGAETWDSLMVDHQREEGKRAEASDNMQGKERDP